jgi:hypothetical protein
VIAITNHSNPFHLFPGAAVVLVSDFLWIRDQISGASIAKAS